MIWVSSDSQLSSPKRTNADSLVGGLCTLLGAHRVKTAGLAASGVTYYLLWIISVGWSVTIGVLRMVQRELSRYYLLSTLLYSTLASRKRLSILVLSCIHIALITVLCTHLIVKPWPNNITHRFQVSGSSRRAGGLWCKIHSRIRRVNVICGALRLNACSVLNENE